MCQLVHCESNFRNAKGGGVGVDLSIPACRQSRVVSFPWVPFISSPQQDLLPLMRGKHGGKESLEVVSSRTSNRDLMKKKNIKSHSFPKARSLRTLGDNSESSTMKDAGDTRQRENAMVLSKMLVSCFLGGFAVDQNDRSRP